jgi:hypothetical protein
LEITLKVSQKAVVPIDFTSIAGISQPPDQGKANVDNERVALVKISDNQRALVVCGVARGQAMVKYQNVHFVENQPPQSVEATLKVDVVDDVRPFA